MTAICSGTLGADDRFDHAVCAVNPHVWSRIGPQSDPPGYGGGEEERGSEVCCEFVAAGCDATPVLEPAEHWFDGVAQPVGLAIEGLSESTLAVPEDQSGLT